MNLEKLKYPIGIFKKPEHITREHIAGWIDAIGTFPERLEKEVLFLDKDQLNLRYRPQGWTIKQVVHHCADSHMNSYIRFKLAMTEDIPAIRPYFEDRWATLPDACDANIQDSLTLIKGLHARWVIFLNELTDMDLERLFVHPEHNQQFSLKENIGIYAWHGNHHLAHIRQAKKFAGHFPD